MAAALKNNSVESCVRNIPGDVPFQFSHTLDISLPCPSQGRTGRCWMFAGMTKLRYLAKHEDELSYAHLFYHDKVERYRQTLITLMDDTLSPSHRAIIYKEAMSDGGQWDLYAALVRRFGVMLRTSMPETFHTNSSRGMNRVANEMLRVHERHARGLPEDKRCDYIHDIVNTDVSTVFAQMLGVPPEVFSGKNDATMKPETYYANMNVDLDQFVSLVHDPRTNESRWHELQYVFDCTGKQRVGWLTVSMETMEKLAMSALIDEKIPVWFGASTTCLDRENGVDDPDVLKYSHIWPWMEIDKKVALETYHRVPSHAMVLTGVHVKSDTPVRWKVQNSWDTNGPHKGYHVMTALGFRYSVFQIVVPKKLLSKVDRLKIRVDAKMVPPDDPLATLARLM